MKKVKEIDLPKNTRVASKYDRVVKELRKKIASGEYIGMLPGTKLLADAYDVSLMTADKAVKVLEREGLVTRLPRKGTVINPSSPVEARTLAVVVRDVSLPLTSRVVGQLGKLARERRFQTLFFQHFDDEKRELAIARELAKEKRVGGVVLVASSFGKPGAASGLLEKAGIPAVELSVAGGDISKVTCHWIRFEEEAAFAEGTKYLISQGHDKTSLVFPVHCEGVPVDKQYEEDPRWRGYSAAMKSAGLLPLPPIWFNADKALDPKERRMFMKAIKSCTALFAHHDRFAATILATLHRNGIHVPGEISLMSYDGAPMTEALDLTTMTLPLEDAALRAADILEGCIGGKITEPVHQVLSPELVVRGSVGAIS